MADIQNAADHSQSVVATSAARMYYLSALVLNEDKTGEKNAPIRSPQNESTD